MKRFVPACLGLSAMLLASSCAGVDLSGLDDSPNVGPCPVAGVLYDANRVVEVKGPERHENVGFTGAIEAVRGFCRYVGTNPITMEIEIDRPHVFYFELTTQPPRAENGLQCEAADRTVPRQE